MAAHFGRDLVQLQQELHRMKVATQEQVKNIEITREVNIILNICFKGKVHPKMPFQTCMTLFLLWNANNVVHTMNVKRAVPLTLTL